MDANERRTSFLSSELSDRDRWPSVSILRGRAEELGHDEEWREQFELVSSRSFGPPGVAAECGGSFVAVGGFLLISEPPDTDPQARWPSDGLGSLNLERSSRYRFDGRFGFQILMKVAPLDERYPRRVGIPNKRPLF
jgi:16S rRNA (guanine527-N7)-methyltransferase